MGQDLPVAERLSCRDVGVRRVGREHGTRELAHLLTTDEVGLGRGEDATDELGVYWHSAIL